MSSRLSSELLGPNGPFASRVDGYQVRAGQLEVTAAVERLLVSDGVLLCEAGTGIGKTFAYLVPALLSGRKVVISTATKALQEQIAYRDLPLVQQCLGTQAPVAVMKGLSNYLCRRRYREFLLSQEAIRPDYASPLRLLSDWARHTEVGDLAELSSLSEAAPVRLHVASSSETRLGPTCAYHEECFVTAMKREAEAAQIIVVNHHLFFADLSLRGPHPGRVIPDYDVAILDEAHQIEDTAALFFGVRVTCMQLRRAIKEAERHFIRAAPLGGSLDPDAHSPTIVEAQQSVDELVRALSPSGGGRRLLPPAMWKGPLLAAALRLDNALADLGSAARSRADAQSDDFALRESLEQSSRRMDALREGVLELRSKKEGRVIWLETADGKIAMNSTPVDLSETLRERLFSSVPAVALLSATLATHMESKPPQVDQSGSPSQGPGAAGDGDESKPKKPETSGFAYVRSRLGLPDDATVREMSVPSPFSYEKQCVLYLPRDLPLPGTPEFLDRAASRICELVEMIDGGAFVLTTSLASMRGLHERLREKLVARLLLVQGERPKNALLSAFRANGAAVLVATSSFWEGIDVPGNALRLVVLEKIPFAVPTDPVFQARGQALEEAGKSAFAHLALPGASLSLKQGFGRLIRREDDVGIVALFDERVHNKGYGKRLLRALPPAYCTSELSEVAARILLWPKAGG